MTTSYELSLRLKELGVEQTGGEYYWMKSNGFFLDENENVVPVEDVIQLMYHKDLVREDTILCRALTLGELVRMLPSGVVIDKLTTGFLAYTLDEFYNIDVNYQHSSPEEAAGELWAELLKQDINQKEA